jgi:hypothetical protein
MTTALVVAVSVLGTLTVVLTVALVRGWRAQTPPPAPEPEPAVEEPPDAPEPAPFRLDDELHEAAARAVETPRSAEPPPRAAAAPNGPTGAQELEALLAQALETACAIPGADAAFVSVTLGREPVVGTLALARQEADRLASTLPSPLVRTRSIEIAYEYEREPYDDLAAGRIERGIAVPVPGSTPALLVILTRAPAAELGLPQLELLEEIARRLGPALAAVRDARAVRMPVTINMREVDGPGGRVHATASGEREERHKAGQVDWLGRR